MCRWLRKAEVGGRHFGGSGKCMRWVSPILQSVSLDSGGMGHHPDRQHCSLAGGTRQPLYRPNREGDAYANNRVLFGTQSQEINLETLAHPACPTRTDEKGSGKGIAGGGTYVGEHLLSYDVGIFPVAHQIGSGY